MMRTSLQIKFGLALLLTILLPATAMAASVTLKWQANQEPDIAGYNVYYGTASRNYGPPIPVGNKTSYTFDKLTEGKTYYFALTATDTSGNESGYSSEVTANATSSEPATVPYRLLFSTNSDRSNAAELNGQTLDDNVFIYLDPDSNVSQVVYAIDGQNHNTENYAPYDLGGDSGFNPTSLSNGSHTISAMVRLQDGTSETVSAGCTVVNGSSSASGSGSLTQVSMWWTSHPGRESAVPVRVYDGTQLLDTLKVNQQANGGKWNSIGSYEFVDTPKVEIVALGKEVTVADALRFIAPDGTVRIIDNDTTGTSHSGSWRVSSVSGYYGNNSLYNNSKGSYTFALDSDSHSNSPSGSGNLTQVSMWWTSHPGRESAVPVRVYDGTQLLDTLKVNQQANGGKWNSIGIYEFSDRPKVEIVSLGNAITVADAVRFVAPDGEITIIDNGGSGSSASGLWAQSSVGGYYGSVSLYCSGAGTYSYSQSSTSPSSTNNTNLTQVSMWWTSHFRRESAVPVRIYDGNQLLDTVTVNQQANGGKWNSIGIYEFSDRPKVEIVSLGNAITVADAVRFVAPDGEITIIDNGGSGSSASGLWAQSSVGGYYGSVSLYCSYEGTYSFQAEW